MDHDHGGDGDRNARVIFELSKLQKLLDRQDSSIYEKVDRVHKVGQAIYWAGGIIVGVTLWVAGIQFTVTAISAKTAAHEIVIATQIRVIDALQNQCNAATEELQKRAVAVERINEMWLLKEYGITNRDDYLRKHGTPPTIPSIPPKP